MIKLIALDYGHGCDTKGKCSPDKRFYEYRFNRRLGKIVKGKLLELGFEVFETVTDDYDVSLRERAKRANQHKAELFVSIHANAAGGDSRWHSARGWSIFVSKNCSEKSKLLATKIAENANKWGFKVRKPLPQQPYWQENFTVLTETKMPAVLVENLFYDNPDDLKMLEDENVLNELANVIVGGIVLYV